MSVILLVEDQAICREPLAKLLKYEGFDVATAANGVEALKLLESTSVDLMLLDLILPKLSGLALLETVRRDARWRAMPVIALTGLMDSSQIARVQELTVNAIFTKARFSIEELLDAIRRSLMPAPIAAAAESALPVHGNST